jgi:hypothetical protein
MSMAKIGRPRNSGIPTYAAIHARINVLLGPALLYRCVKCAARASEWAYDGTDSDEIEGLDSCGYGPFAYSLDPEFYYPMCRKCHRRKDSGLRVVRRKNVI